MHPSISIVTEPARGCGFRRPGAYLRGGGLGHPCLKLDIPLFASHEGFSLSFSRSWSAIVPKNFLTGTERMCAENSGMAACAVCPAALANAQNRAILNWVGAENYTPDSIIKESKEVVNGTPRGFSRRVNWETIPDWVEVGKTWVFQAHLKSMRWEQVVVWENWRGIDVSQFSYNEETNPFGYKPDDYIPSIFHAFRLQEVEYVVRGDEPDEYIDDLIKRGFKPVRVIPVDDNGVEVPDEVASEFGDDNEKRVAKVQKRHERERRKQEKQANKRPVGRPRRHKNNVPDGQMPLL